MSITINQSEHIVTKDEVLSNNNYKFIFIEYQCKLLAGVF